MALGHETTSRRHVAGPQGENELAYPFVLRHHVARTSAHRRVRDAGQRVERRRAEWAYERLGPGALGRPFGEAEPATVRVVPDGTTTTATSGGSRTGSTTSVVQSMKRA